MSVAAGGEWEEGADVEVVEEEEAEAAEDDFEDAAELSASDSRLEDDNAAAADFAMRASAFVAAALDSAASSLSISSELKYALLC